MSVILAVSAESRTKASQTKAPQSKYLQCTDCKMYSLLMLCITFARNLDCYLTNFMLHIEKLTGYCISVNLKKFILKSADIIISALFFQVTLINLRICLLTSA